MVKLKGVFIIIALFFIHSTIAQAQDNANKKQPTSLVFAHQEIIHSNILNKDRIINIALPEKFYEVSKQHTYPVLLLLENEFFQMVSGVVKHLSSVERMPETIVISLIDEPSTPTIYTNGSDFWPTNWKQLEGENPDLFTKYLEQELFPYLKNTYRANDFSIVMGLSWTSIYTLHSFTKEPDLFDAHIAIASGDILGMGYNEGESFIDLFVNDLKNSKRKKGYLYVTSADADGGGTAPMIKENLEELEKRLSLYRTKDFQFISKIFSNEGHYDVALPALNDALGLIFPKEEWFARYRDIIKKPGNAMKNIDSYYQNLSIKYGFEILPKAERWNSVNRLSWIGPFLLRENKIVEAIEVLERWVEYSPKSALALSELARAYEANNELKKALKSLEKASEISNKPDEYLNEINLLKGKIKNQ